MIFKELDPFVAQDKYDKAGRNAEVQMAHYLLRFFGKSTTFDVLNGIRVEHDGEVAQMDHIVIHPFGIIIIESKSVAGSVQIKDDGQWMRWSPKYNKPFGMRSPITQAQMQCALLKDLLQANVKQQEAFSRLSFDVIVAISDGGTIQWPTSGALPAVCKADQVPAKVEGLLAALTSKPGNNVPLLTNPENRKKIAEFLLRIHKPVAIPEPEEKVQEPVVKEPTTQAAQPALPAKACKYCSSEDLELTYGKYGYYFHCKSCQKNTNLHFDCPDCGEEGKIRKSGKEFFAECRSCTASRPYFVNT